MKGFIAGLFVGAAAFAIGQRLIYPSQPASDIGQPTLVAPVQMEQRVASRSEASNAAQSSTADIAPGRITNKLPTTATASSYSPVADQAGSAEVDPDCACAAGWHFRKAMREQAARRAEAKDTDWAYSMEQLVQQFAVTHRQGRKFEISSVDCRTTYCDIRASGHSEEAQEAFQLVMQEAAREPWSEFTQGTEGGSESNGETIKMYSILTRR